MKKLIAATFTVLSLTAMQAMAGSPVHMWKCQINDDMTEEALVEYTNDWQKAAVKVYGGKKMKSQIYFPVAAGADGTGTDLIFVSSWPNFGEYGKFWDSYTESDAEGMEGGAMSCHGSSLWEAMN